MNKKIVLLGTGILFAAVSCKFLGEEEEQRIEAGLFNDDRSGQAINDKLSLAQIGNSSRKMPALATSERAPAKEEEPAKVQEDLNKGPITHYDTKKLDDQVREEARRLGKDPASHRKLTQVQADGTKIYRELGMHIIAPPNDKEVFLPDEI